MASLVSVVLCVLCVTGLGLGCGRVGGLGNGLHRGAGEGMVGSMTAVEVINEIETLDPKERAEVFRFVHRFEAQAQEEAGRPQVKIIPDREFRESVEFILKHHAPLLRKLAE